jgi:hypothetical protein
MSHDSDHYLPGIHASLAGAVAAPVAALSLVGAAIEALRHKNEVALIAGGVGAFALMVTIFSAYLVMKPNFSKHS